MNQRSVDEIKLNREVQKIREGNLKKEMNSPEKKSQAIEELLKKQEEQ